MAFYITASFLESGQVNAEGIANAIPKDEQNFVHYRQIRGREFKEGKPHYGPKPMNLTKVRQLFAGFFMLRGS